MARKALKSSGVATRYNSKRRLLTHGIWRRRDLDSSTAVKLVNLLLLFDEELVIQFRRTR
jgi:hypothetical protein